MSYCPKPQLVFMALSINSNKSQATNSIKPLNLALRFTELNDFLLEHQGFWQQRVYVSPEPDWKYQYPQLYQFLLGLDEAAVTRLQDQAAAVEALAEFVPGLTRLSKLQSLEAMPARELPACSRFFQQGIPGRKWQQLQAFGQHCQPVGERYVDWCCGKAHLGRYLQQLDNLPVLGYEWQRQLVDEANQLAGDGSTHVEQADVLAEDFSAEFRSTDQVLALHACGDLHKKLLNQVVHQQVKALNLVPCCYQKTRHSHYQPLSTQARLSSLQLGKDSLHTAVQETVTAGAAVDSKRKQLQAWRLGFDCWQREFRGVDEYLQVPSLPQSSLHWGFKAFCLHLAEHLMLTPAADTDWRHYQKLGQQRFDKTHRLDIARQVFRRGLELWLVLDQALYLQEHCYQVQLREFCEPSLSPRNIMVSAVLT